MRDDQRMFLDGINAFIQFRRKGLRKFGTVIDHDPSTNQTLVVFSNHNTSIRSAWIRLEKGNYKLLTDGVGDSLAAPGVPVHSSLSTFGPITAW